MVQWGGQSRGWFLIYAWSKLPLLKPHWGCWGCSKELPVEGCLPWPTFGPNSRCCCSWKPHWWCWGCDGELLVESCLPWLCESATTATTKFNRTAKPWFTHITNIYFIYKALNWFIQMMHLLIQIIHLKTIWNVAYAWIQVYAGKQLHVQNLPQLWVNLEMKQWKQANEEKSIRKTPNYPPTPLPPKTTTQQQPTPR